MSARAPRRAAHRAGKEEEGRLAQTRAQCAERGGQQECHTTALGGTIPSAPFAGAASGGLIKARLLHPGAGLARKHSMRTSNACAPRGTVACARLARKHSMRTSMPVLPPRGTVPSTNGWFAGLVKKRNKKCHPALELAGRRTNLKVCSAVLTRRCSKRWGAQRYSGSVGSLAHARRQSIWAHAAGSADGQSRQGRARRRRRSWQALRCASVAADGAHSPWLCELLRRPPAQCCSVCAC